MKNKKLRSIIPIAIILVIICITVAGIIISDIEKKQKWNEERQIVLDKIKTTEMSFIDADVSSIGSVLIALRDSGMVQQELLETLFDQTSQMTGESSTDDSQPSEEQSTETQSAEEQSTETQPTEEQSIEEQSTEEQSTEATTEELSEDEQYQLEQEQRSIENSINSTIDYISSMSDKYTFFIYHEPSPSTTKKLAYAEKPVESDSNIEDLKYLNPVEGYFYSVYYLDQRDPKTYESLINDTIDSKEYPDIIKAFNKCKEAATTLEEDEMVGDYTVQQNANKKLYIALANELLNNSEKYETFLSTNIVDILSNRTNLITLDESTGIEELLDRTIDSDKYLEDGTIDFTDIKACPDDFDYMKALLLANISYRVSNSSTHKTDESRCFLLYQIIKTKTDEEHPELMRYVRRQKKIYYGESLDIPELPVIEPNPDVKIRNAVSEPYEIDFPKSYLAPLDFRYIRHPETGRIMISISDFETATSITINRDEIKGQYVTDEKTKEDYMDITVASQRSPFTWFYDESKEKLYYQEGSIRKDPNNHPTEWKEYLESIKGVPLPLVILTLSTNNNPVSPTEEVYEEYIRQIVNNAYSVGYEDLIYSLLDYARYLNYTEQYELSEDEDKYNTDMIGIKYGHYLYQGITSDECSKFLPTFIKEFLSTNDLKNMEIVEPTDENIKEFVRNLRHSKYDIKIPRGYEMLYKATKFVSDMENNPNYSAGIYPSSEDTVLLGLCQTIVYDKIYTTEGLHDIWFNIE